MAAMKSHLLPTASPEDYKEVARGCFTVGQFGNTSAWSRAAFQIASIHDSGRSRKLQLGLRWLQDNDKRWPLLRRSRRSHRPLHYPAPPQSDVHEYKSVCVEQGYLRPSSSELFCTMSTNYGDPRLILRPHKIEVLSLKPRIVVFPGFLTSAELDYIRAAAQKGFKRAGIYAHNNVAGVPSWKRIGKVSWLWDHKHPLLQRLSRRIATATKLSLESAEAYQVANYGLGGHYTPHQDAHQFDKVADDVDTADGNRLATMLMYLTDVAAGGATAFVTLGIAIKPQAGDALFWYNFEPYEGSEAPEHFSFWHQKRKADDLTDHVGCPVLSGCKWIVTKWIHERTNLVVRYNTPG
ncbi:prolyl 4-hydroxylase subunit alpha-2-like [Amblyomma americanum]